MKGATTWTRCSSVPIAAVGSPKVPSAAAAAGAWRASRATHSSRFGATTAATSSAFRPARTSFVVGAATGSPSRWGRGGPDRRPYRLSLERPDEPEPIVLGRLAAANAECRIGRVDPILAGRAAVVQRRAARATVRLVARRLPVALRAIVRVTTEFAHVLTPFLGGTIRREGALTMAVGLDHGGQAREAQEAAAQ